MRVASLLFRHTLTLAASVQSQQQALRCLVGPSCHALKCHSTWQLRQQWPSQLHLHRLRHGRQSICTTVTAASGVPSIARRMRLIVCMPADHLFVMISIIVSVEHMTACSAKAVLLQMTFTFCEFDKLLREKMLRIDAGSATKLKQDFKCKECGKVFGQWTGKCLGCGGWNTCVSYLAPPCCIVHAYNTSIYHTALALTVAEHCCCMRHCFSTALCLWNMGCLAMAYSLRGACCTLQTVSTHATWLGAPNMHVQHHIDNPK